jgi:hypothetical protein
LRADSISSGPSAIASQPATFGAEKGLGPAPFIRHAQHRGCVRLSLFVSFVSLWFLSSIIG